MYHILFFLQHGSLELFIIVWYQVGENENKNTVSKRVKE